MVKHIALFLFLVCMASNNALADACGGCATGYWCETTVDTSGTTSQCVRCTNGPSYDNKQCGDTGSGCHYTTSAESSNTCSWECDNQGDICIGFYKSGNACASYKYNVTESSATFHEGNSENTYFTRCSSDQTLKCLFKCDTSGRQSCGGSGTQYGTCINNSKDCTDKNLIRQACSGFAVDGNARLQDASTETYNYSNCSCTKGNQSVSNGTANITVRFNNTGEASTEEISITSCNAGYYANNNECVQTSPGYYSPDGDTTQKKCPYGATSEARATSAGECFFNNTTPIKDSTNGTYTLPSDVKIYLSSGTLLD